MRTPSCSRCEDLRPAVPIETPGDLAHVLRVVRANIADGTLVEDDFWPTGRLKFEQPPFLSIPESGPRPDAMEYYFSCTACGQRYRLGVETYKGRGGSWSPSARED